MEEEARRILRAALAGHAAPHTDLARAIRALSAPLSGVDLGLPERQPRREPPRFDRRRIGYNSSTSSGPPQRSIVKSRISSTSNHPREPLSNHADTGDPSSPACPSSFPYPALESPDTFRVRPGRCRRSQVHPFRIHPVLIAVRVDECRHDLGRRSSSAWVEYADALRRISFARRSSWFSRSSSFRS